MNGRLTVLLVFSRPSVSSVNDCDTVLHRKGGIGHSLYRQCQRHLWSKIHVDINAHMRNEWNVYKF